MSEQTTDLRETVRRRYAAAAVLKGTIEAIPLPANTIDAVISNRVVNLSTDKPAVFAEIFRVLNPGGRIGVSDVVADDTLPPQQRGERGDHVGCIAGALSFAEYRAGLEAAGFTDVSITPMQAVADGMHSAIVRAVKPVPADTSSAEEEAAGDVCCGANACCTSAENSANPTPTVSEAKSTPGCGCYS